MMIYEIIEGENAFLKFEPDYRMFYESVSTGNPFNSPEWIYTWYDHHRNQGTPYLIAIYSDRDRRLVGTFALFLMGGREWHQPSLRLVPMAYDSADYLEPLCERADHAVLDTLMSAVAKLLRNCHGELYIPQAPQMFAQSLCDVLSRRHIRHVARAASRCPYIQLTATFEDFLNARFKPKTRQTLRRKQRRLSDVGEVSIRVAQSDSELDALLPIVAEIETQSWKGDANIGLFSPRTKAFYGAVLKRLVMAGEARISLLTVDEEPIAYEIGLLSQAHYMMYGTGYLPRYERYSPGAQLMLKNIEYAIDAGCHVYDFMCGNESYKSQWATHSMHNRAISVFSSDLRGSLRYQVLNGYTRLRGVARRIAKGSSNQSRQL